MADTEEAHAAASTSITSITPTDKDATKSKLPQSSLHCENFMCLLFLVCVLLNATGNVPIIKKRTWTVDPNKTVSWIQKFIHKYLKLDATEQIVGSLSPVLNPDLILLSLQFLYVNQTFAPAPDQIIKNLYDCHGTNGKLVLYYCKNQAWG